MEIEFEWEPLDKWGDEGEITCRAKVFGGWIVKAETYNDGKRGFKTTNLSLVFVPDPKHEWELVD